MHSIVKGNEKYVNVKTGEVINVQDILKKVSGNYFWKVKMMDFLRSLDIIGTKSVRVYSFILGHINQHSNRLKMTEAQIQYQMEKNYLRNHGNTSANQKKARISIKTISTSLNKLEHIIIRKNNKPLLMRKRYGRYGRYSYLMINPAMLMRGSEGKRQGLLIQYDNVDSKENKAKRRYKRKQRRQKNLDAQKKAIKINKQGAKVINGKD